MNPKIMIGLRATQGVFMVIVLGTAAYGKSLSLRLRIVAFRRMRETMFNF